MSNQFTPPDTEGYKLEVIKTLAKKWDFKTDKKVVEEWRRLCAAYDSSATRLEAVSAARVAMEYGELKDRSIEHVVEGKPELIASKAESKATFERPCVKIASGQVRPVGNHLTGRPPGGTRSEAADRRWPGPPRETPGGRGPNP